MATGVFRNSVWLVIHPVFPVLSATTEIDFFEPQRMKSFIEPAELGPDLATKHEKGPGRLLDLETTRVVEPQSPIPPVHPIVRTDPVKQESFQNQRRRSGKLPRHETDLRAALRINETSARARDARQTASVPKRFDTGH